MNKRLRTGIILALGLGAGAPCAADGGTVRLVGADTANSKLLIRMIDDGDILWVGKYQLGTRASTTPGPHRVNVMCQFIDPLFTEYKPGNVAIDGKDGETIELSGTPSKDGRSCEVTAAKR